jgi:phosphoribosylformylglycinamidine synthase
MGNAITENEQSILLIGATQGHLGASLYLREIEGREEGAPPPVDLDAEVENGNFVRQMIETHRIAACHDLSDGGLLVALAEMCLPREIGAQIEFPADIHPIGFAFGEDQARYLVAVAPEHLHAVIAEAEKAGVPCFNLGTTGGTDLEVEGHFTIAVSELKKANEDWLPNYMAG